MKKVVAQNLNANKTSVENIMTPNPRVARETDDLIDWLRIMSNERFRRLPVVDENGHIKQCLLKEILSPILGQI
jgi:predicted transcriptional regulator